jgi:microcompartment protein CcmK/EutM
MEGWKLLVVQPFGIDGKTPDGDPQLAVDSIGAGKGDRVIITSDGQATRKLLKNDATPVRWHVMGVCD